MLAASRASTRPAMITMYASATGRKIFHPNDISWSYLNRGSVQRIQMKRKRKNAHLSAKISIDSRTIGNDTAAVLSAWVNGMSQPPKNSVAIIALAVIMLAYSAMKNSENFIALYSV